MKALDALLRPVSDDRWFCVIDLLVDQTAKLDTVDGIPGHIEEGLQAPSSSRASRTRVSDQPYHEFLRKR
jgi:hypothetical protein